MPNNTNYNLWGRLLNSYGPNLDNKGYSISFNKNIILNVDRQIDGDIG